MLKKNLPIQGAEDSIIKHFNEDVINAVRKEEIKRLEAAGEDDAANQLKKGRFVLLSKRSTLEEKDERAKAFEEKKEENKNTGGIFNLKESKLRGGNVEALDNLINNNKLLSIAVMVRDALNTAYDRETVESMANDIDQIIHICKETNNKNFIKFANLLSNHKDGIVTYPKYHITSAKIEGFNNKVKTLRRKAFGYRSDEYFFLKIIDISQPKSEKEKQADQRRLERAKNRLKKLGVIYES